MADWLQDQQALQVIAERLGDVLRQAIFDQMPVANDTAEQLIQVRSRSPYSRVITCVHVWPGHIANRVPIADF